MGENRIYLERINAMACRDYRCFSGKHEFRFPDEVTQLRGSNGSGKTTILNLISLAFEPELFFDHHSYQSHDSNSPSIVEVDFIAGGKRHILYRCFKDLQNISTYITLFEEDGLIELNDEEALDYLSKITQPHRLADESSFIRSREYRQTNPDKMKRMMNLINTWNSNRKSYIRHLFCQNGRINFVDYHGSTQSLDMSAAGPKTIISNMINLASIVHEKSTEKITKVVLIDDMFRKISDADHEEMVDLIKILTEEYGIQFIITNHIRGLSKSFQIDRPAIPNIYRTEDNKLSHSQWFNKKINPLWTQTTYYQRTFRWKV